MNRLTFLGLILLMACNSPKRTSDEIANYKSEIDTWHRHRVEELLGPSGWVNVRGLFWLKEGINSFGSDVSNDIVFPEGKIAGKAGFFILKDTIVRMEVLPGVSITSMGAPFKSSIIYPPDSSGIVLESNSLQWFIIKRSDKIGVRLRDLESDKLKTFTGIERYASNLDWKFTAKLSVSPGKKVEIVNVLGQTHGEPVKGTIIFTHQGKEYSLEAIDDEGMLFIIFADETNGNETYGSGRYLKIDMPTEGDIVELDFNKSYNPPCAFTEFATCLLPPRQNRLPFAVPAGEKNYHH